jgi:uncharacterized repeat protein (TIGR01451 family)/gliding motility-associated-like protein
MSTFTDIRNKITRLAKLQRFTLLLLLTFGMLMAHVKVSAQPVVLDLQYSQMSFLNSNKVVLVNNGNNGFTQGSVHRYNNLVSRNGITVYGILTIQEVNNAVITNFDDDVNFGVPSRFQPRIGVTSNSGGYIVYHLRFYNSANNEDVFVYNYYITGIDVDGNSSSNREFNEHGGFTSYTVNNPTQLVITSNNTTGRTRFLGRTSSLDGLNFDNSASYIMNYTNPNNVITFALGQTSQNTERFYSLHFGPAGGTFNNPQTTPNALPLAIDDIGIPVNSNTGGTAVANVLSNDIFNSQPVVPSQVTLTVPVPASHPGVVLNTSTGAVTVAPGTPPGVYTLMYQICMIANPADRCDMAAVTVQVLEANLSVTKTDSPDPVIAGNNITYTITVTNNGPTLAQNVQLTDALGTGLSFVSASSSTGTWNNPVWNIGTMANGATATLTLVANVASNVTGTVSNTATVSSPTYDPVPGNNTATQNTTVITRADLAVTKTDSPDPVVAGQSLTYTITVTNSGPSDALDVSLLDNLPAGLTVTNVSTLDGNWNAPTWQIGTIAAGTQKVLVIETLVGAGVTGSLSNTAVVSSSTTDPQPSNNTVTQTTTVNTLSDVAITKTAPSNLFVAGDTVEYTIVVSNSGPSNAAGVQVSDNIPAVILLPEFSLDGGQSWAAWTGNYGVGTLNVSETTQLLIRGKLAANAVDGSSIINTATVTSTTPDPVTTNNQSQHSATVQAIADMSIVKIGPSAILAGTTITYSLTVVNNGPSYASNLVIADAVSPLITNVEYSLNNGNSWNIWNGTRNLAIFDYPGSNFILIRGDVSPDFTGDLLNTATVTSTTVDPNNLNNQSSVSTTVTAQADLIISKTETISPLQKNGPVNYVITVLNNGPSTAQNIVITDIINPLETSGAEYLSGSQWLPWTGGLNVGTLKRDSIYTLQIRGTITNNASDPVVNTASVLSDVPDPDLLNNTQTISTTLETEADLAIVKTAPATIHAGDTIVYSITVTNTSVNMNAENVLITDNVDNSRVPSPQYSTNGGTTWNNWSGTLNIGTLNFGSTYSFIIRGKVLSNATGSLLNNTATVGSSTSDPVLSNNSSTVSTQITRLADISVEKTVLTAPEDIKAGAVIEYLLIYSNSGPSDATNYIITDIVPAEISQVTASRCQSAFLPWPSNFNAGTVVAGGVCTIVIRGIVSSSFSGSLPNTASVASEVPDNDLTNNSSTISVTVTESADLQIIASAIPNPVIAGDTVLYTLIASNNGPSNAVAVQVSGAIPADFDNAIYSIDGGTTWNNWTGSISLGNFNVLQSATILVKAVTKRDLTNGAVINYTASITSSTTDPNLLNNLSSVSLTVQTVADLSIVKTSNILRPSVGDEVVFSLNVLNAGPSIASSVMVNDLLPSGFQYVSHTGAVSYSSVSGVWNIGQLNYNATVQLNIRARVIADGNYTNIASVSGADTDPNLTNNSSSVTIIPDIESVYAVTTPQNVDSYLNAHVLATVSDGDGNIVSSQLISGTLPPGSTLNTVNGTITVSNNTQLIAGVYTFVITTTDIVGGTTTQTVVIEILPDIESQYQVTTARNVDDYATGEILASVSDLDGDLVSIVFNSGTLPPGTQFVPATGQVIVSNASNLVAGTYLFNVTTIDITGGRTTQDVTIVINPDIESVYTTIPPTNLFSIVDEQVLAWVSDADGTIISSVHESGTMPAGTDFNEVTGQIFVVDPELLQPGIHTVEITTRDITGGVTTQFVTFEILAADLSVVKTSNPINAVAGDEYRYFITVSNAGPSTAENVMVTEYLPSEFTITNAIPSKGTWNSNVWSVGSIPVGESEVLELIGNVDPSTLDELINMVNVASSTSDPFLGNNDDVLNSPVENVADISIVKTGPEVVTAGTNVTYTLTVLNNGPGYGYGVSISDILPTQLSNGQYSLNNGNSWQPWSGLRYLPVFMSVPGVNNILVRGDLSTSATGSITNIATVSSVSTDPNLDNNSSSVTSQIQSVADLVLSKQALTSPIIKNQQVVYRVSVFNDGPSDAVDLVITDVIDNDFIANAEYSVDEGVSWLVWTNTYNLPLLANENTFALLIRGLVTNNVPNPLVNTASVTSSVFDPNELNNTRTIQTPLEDQADVSVVKTTPEILVAGTEIEYTLTVTNNSTTITALDVSLTDNIDDSKLSNPTFSFDGGTTWFNWTGYFDLGNLVPGAVRTVLIKAQSFSNIIGTLSNTAQVFSNTPDPDLSNNTSTVTSTINRFADLAVSKELLNPEQALVPGSEVQYLITYSNLGPSDAENYIITDIIPQQLINVESSRCQSAFLPWNGSFNAGTVVAGGVCTILIRAIVSQDVVGEVKNIVTVSSDAHDFNIVNNSDSAFAYVELRADLAIVKSTASASIVAGQNITYTINVQNNGPSDAMDVVVTDMLPSNLVFVSANSLTGTWSGQQWTIGTLLNGASAQLQLVARVNSSVTQGSQVVNTATVTSSVTDHFPDNNSSTVTTLVTNQSAIRVTKTGSPDLVYAGENITYEIIVYNDGPSDAYNLVLADALPAEVNFVSATSGGVLSGRTVSWAIPTMTSGSQQTFTLVVSTHDDLATGTIIRNVATIRQPQKPDVDSNEEEIPVESNSQLSITKSVDMSTVYAGGIIKYYIDIVNQGPSVANNVVVVDTIPQGTTFVQAINNGLLHTGYVVWNFSSLQVNEMQRLILYVRADSNLDSGTVIRNVAYLRSGNHPDPEISNPVDVNIITSADIVISKSGSPKPVIAGNTINYTITVKNNGPSDARNVTVEEQLPTGLLLQSVSYSRGTWNAPVWSVGTIAAGEELQLVVTAKVSPSLPEGQSIANVVIATSTTDDPDPENNTDTDITTVVISSDVSILKTTSATVVAGANITYDIIVTNNGPSDAYNVLVSDELPSNILNPQYSLNSGVTWIAWTGSVSVGNIAANSIYGFKLRGLVESGSTGTISNTAEVTTGSPDPNPENNTDTEITRIVVEADLSINKSGPANVVAGQPILYVLTITPGTSNAENVVLTDTIPSVISNVEYSLNLGSIWTSWPVDHSIDMGTVTAGQPVQILVRGLVNPETINPIVNTAWVETTSDDPDQENNRDTEITPVIPIADLSVDKTNGQSEYIPGDTVQYMILVRNSGPSDVENALLTDYQVAGVQFISWTATGSLGTAYVASGIGSIEQYVDLPAGGTISYTLNAAVSGTFNGNLVNTVSITPPANTIDPVVENNTATDVDVLTSKTRLVIDKKADRSVVLAGTNVTYTITVTNAGPTLANNVTVTDVLQTGLAFVSASNSGVYQAGVVEWNITTVEVGQTIGLTLVAKTSPDLKHGTVLKNIAVVKGENTDDPDETPPIEIVVNVDNDVVVTKKASSSTVYPGDQLTYTIVVANNGPGNESNIVVSDTIPAGLVFVSAGQGGILNGNVVKWENQSVPSGTQKTYTLTVTVPVDVIAGTQFRNIAVVTTDNPEGPYISDPEIVTVTSGANVVITKTGPATVMAGSVFSYTISISNIGTGKAFNVSITDELSDFVTFVSSSVNTTINNGLLTWNFAEIQASEMITILLEVKANDDLPSGTVISNIALMKTPQDEDEIPSNEVSTTVGTIVLIANDDTGEAVYSNEGGISVQNILANDLYGSVTPTTDLVQISQISTSSANINIDTATGRVIVNEGTPAGTYVLEYRICLLSNPTVCDQAIVTVTVQQYEIIANNDVLTILNGNTSGVNGYVILSNDLLGNQPVDDAEVLITIVDQLPPGVYLNTFTGEITIDAGLPEGSHQFTYSICEVVNPANCDEATVTINVSRTCEMIIPTGFSPNGDGIQEYFRITCIENYPDAAIEIYNRWGNLIFKKENYGNRDKWGETDAWWDGRSTHSWNIGNDKVPTGTYFYVLYLNSGDEKPKAGSVFINR